MSPPGRESRPDANRAALEERGCGGHSSTRIARYPGPAIDLIRSGVPAQELKAEGRRAVWRALVSTATSAQAKRHRYIDWAATMDEAQSNLGHQVKANGGRRELTSVQFEKQLGKAWTTAQRYLASAPPACTADDFRQAATLLAGALDDLPTDGWVGQPFDRRVLRYVLGRAASIGTSSPTVPCRPAAEALGATPMAVCRALARLVKGGWLDLAERGRPRGPSTLAARASRYRLPAERLSARLRGDPHIPMPYTGMSNGVLGMSNGSNQARRNSGTGMSNAPTERTSMTAMITITRTAAVEIIATLPAEGGDLEVLARTLIGAGLTVRLEPEQNTGPAATVTTLSSRRPA